MKYILTAAILLLMSSCIEDAQTSVQNGNFKVEYLFEEDGCKVYRFRDGGRYIYWSNCRGKMQDDKTHNNGKITTVDREETINN